LARLIYSTIASLDGYTADEKGDFDWAAPDEELHRYVNDLERPVGTYLYGRRMYETMRFWETPEAVDGQPDVVRDFAQIWRAADKVVFSRTLDRASSARTRIEREFSPDSVERWKASSERDLTIGGPKLAGQAIGAGLVDEFQFFLVPELVGGGTAFLPERVRAHFKLVDVRRFENGVVYLRYRKA
jgi:dihydrofolate reductase